VRDTCCFQVREGQIRHRRENEEKSEKRLTVIARESIEWEKEKH